MVETEYRTEEKLSDKKLWRIWQIGKIRPSFFCQSSRLSRQHASMLYNLSNFLSAKISIVGFAKVFYRQVFLPYGSSSSVT